MEINIKNLTFCYNGSPILDNINLDIEQGDFIALLGHNGSGKTTLVKTLIRENCVKNSTIFFDGTDINKFKDWDKIGYVAQKFTNFSFNYPLSVEEILKSSLNDSTRIDEVLKLTNLEILKHKNFNTLSGGQQQRVFIARALLNNPSLLILDEPFVGVDATSIVSLYDLLKQINDNNTTIILITHQEHSIKTYANRIVVLKNKIFYDGNTLDYDDRMCELC